MNVGRAGGLTWTDVLLVVMGVALCSGVVVGALSGVPLRVGSGVGSILAASAWITGVAWNPTPESSE